MYGFFGGSGYQPFEMFSGPHLFAMVLMSACAFLLRVAAKSCKVKADTARIAEKGFALFLLGFEALYHVWMLNTGIWNAAWSLPLQLCSISVLTAAGLLWTGNRHLYSFVYYAGTAGALQAVLTPVLEWNWPHFRFAHFFFTHFGIILAALYFTWVKGYKPDLRGIWITLIILNLLLPFVLAVNYVTGGNYMFLSRKPAGGSILDFLGPYPWYIGSLEFMAIGMFLLLWFFGRIQGRVI